jgi:hypothetical protein
VFLPLVESRGEYKIACGPGCDACCKNFVRCSAAEALLVAEWLTRPENAPALARFRDKLVRWREVAGDAPAQLEAILVEHGGAPTEGPGWEAFNRIGLEYALRGNLCPLNHEGRCEIYPVRPTICRAVHVLETAEYCVPGRGQRPKVVSHPKLEDAAREASVMCSRLGPGLGRGADERSLPEQIAWALAAK